MDPSNTPPAPPDGGAGNPPATPPAAPAQFVVSKDEWLDSRREVRAVKEMLAKLTASPPVAAPAPSDEGKGGKGGSSAPAAPTVDADVRARLDLADAIDESGIALSKENKALVKRLFSAEKPGNAREWLTETLKILPVPAIAAASAAATPVPPPAPIAPSNTGAPAATPSQIQLPEDPRQWPADVVSKMSDEDFHKALADFNRKSGRGNPVAGMRAQLDRRIGRAK